MLKLIAGGFLAILTLGMAHAEDLRGLMTVCAPQVHPQTLGSIVARESGGNPFAILDNGAARLPRNQRVMRSFRPQSREEAISIATSLIQAGHIVDLGLGQVNNFNLGWLKVSVADMFDPCRNLQASQNILLGFWEKATKVYGPGQQSLLAAISGYNTGSLTAGFKNGYVKGVLEASRRPIPVMKVAAPFSTGVVRVVGTPAVNSPGGHGVLARRPTLLSAKLASLDVETF